ncbi:MAG: geranylgeranylglycerol-phosphate geranylgeranyltransferase [Ignavibacteriaceae bacterium]|nr:geranylgeranylglycerol-phosphate geranylgeranyltransferase [Ignavibacteriaceae bacterium]
MIHYIKLFRPVNCLITFLSVIVAAFIASFNSFPFVAVFFAAVAASLVTAAGNVINDYYDIEIDKISHPERPLVTGVINKNKVIIIYTILNFIALLISFWISPIAFGFVLFTVILLLLYSITLKKVILFGNSIIAFLTGMVFIFGGIVVENVAASVIPAIFAFLINFNREIVKDMEDIEGDLNAGVITFSARYGIKKLKLIILMITAILVLFTIYPFLIQFYKIEYFIFVMILVNPLLVYFLKSIYEDHSKKNLKRMSLLLKLNMLFGLIAIYLGK